VVGPLELFYDLATVVLVAQAAHHLAGHLTWRGLGEFAVVFTLVWIAWINGSLHHELHGRDDARARSTFLLQILVLVAMGAFIPQAGGARGAAFAVATGVLFAILAVLWLLASRGDRPEYRRASRLFVAGTAACAAALVGTAFLPAGARIPAWGLLDVVYLAGFAAAVLASPAQASALLVTDALIERFGLLTIIVLGETVSGVVAGLAGEPVSGLTLAVGLAAVAVGFGAWWTYFDFAGHRHPRTEPAGSLQWLLSHLPLTAAIAAMGAAMVSLVHHAPTAAPRRHGMDTVRRCRRCVVRDDAGIREPASLAVHRGLFAARGTCAAVALACLGLAAARPAPPFLALALVRCSASPGHWPSPAARPTRPTIHPLTRRREDRASAPRCGGRRASPCPCRLTQLSCHRGVSPRWRLSSPAVRITRFSCGRNVMSSALETLRRLLRG
jgi:low temperature requirement protein LtrA